MPEFHRDKNGYDGKYSRKEAEDLDAQDPLRGLRAEFIIPSRRDLKSNVLAKRGSSDLDPGEPSIYLCGNSLGLQPRRTSERVTSHLNAWAAKGVFGHFKGHDDSSLPPFLDIDDVAATKMAPLVGALPSEVAVMETLTANLHLMMSSFYQPNNQKFKIIIEGKAFPSDHYAVESQIRHHGFDPEEAMILVEPQLPQLSTIETSQIISVIDEHASSTALIVLPGIQYYTGQYFDIARITAHAHNHGITIGWDLAHAVGNVDVKLHDWNVDFAVWCNYKYLNSGPGAIAGLFVHDNHGRADMASGNIRPRLSGWWGGDKTTRFQMGNRFVPIPGAAGFQVGNPCALAISAVIASLEIFELTSMSEIRDKSVILTSYLEQLLQQEITEDGKESSKSLFTIITPSNSAERGAQLSVRLQPGLLEDVLKVLEDNGVVVDERKPDVIRVAPAPLYNTFTEVWDFVRIFQAACQQARDARVKNGSDAIALGGQDQKGWSLVK